MKTLTIILVLFLTACSSIPMSTMLHFSKAKPDDFFLVDSQGIRVKVRINHIANFMPTESVNLSASIEDENGLRAFKFPLEMISKTTKNAVKGIFSDQPAVDVFILKLSPEAITNLASIKLASKDGIKKKVGLSAGVEFSDKNIINKKTQLSIMLKLTEKSEFITLIDNWQVKL